MGCPLDDVPGELLERKRNRTLLAWLANRNRRPTLWEIEQERARRGLIEPLPVGEAPLPPPRPPFPAYAACTHRGQESSRDSP